MGLRQYLAVGAVCALAGAAIVSPLVYQATTAADNEKDNNKKLQQELKDTQAQLKWLQDNPKTVTLENIVAHLGDKVPVEKTTTAVKAIESYVSPQNWDVGNLSLEKSTISVNVNDVGNSTVEGKLVYNNGTTVNIGFNLTPDQTRDAIAVAQGHVNGVNAHVFMEPTINVNTCSLERHVDVSEQKYLANMLGYNGKNVTNIVAKLNKADGSLSYSFVVDGKDVATDKANFTLALNYEEDHDTNFEGFGALTDALSMGTQVWTAAYNVGHIAGVDAGFAQGWSASLNDSEEFLLGKIANITGENKSAVLDRVAGKEGATLADVNTTALWGEAYFQAFTHGFGAGDNSGKSVADFLYKNFNGSAINDTIKAKFADKGTDLYNTSQWNRTDLLKLTYDIAFSAGDNSGITISIETLEGILAGHGTPKDLDNTNVSAAGEAFWQTVFDQAYSMGENRTIAHNKINGMTAGYFAGLDSQDKLTSDINWWINTSQSNPDWKYNIWAVDHTDKNFNAMMNWSNADNKTVNATLKDQVMAAYAAGHDVYFMDTFGTGKAGGYIANVQNGKVVGGWIAPQEQIDAGLNYKPK
jgi:hypothetical protein